jgi:hypothetical protein
MPPSVAGEHTTLSGQADNEEHASTQPSGLDSKKVLHKKHANLAGIYRSRNCISRYKSINCREYFSGLGQLGHISGQRGAGFAPAPNKARFRACAKVESTSRRW